MKFKFLVKRHNVCLLKKGTTFLLFPPAHSFPSSFSPHTHAHAHTYRSSQCPCQETLPQAPAMSAHLLPISLGHSSNSTLQSLRSKKSAPSPSSRSPWPLLLQQRPQRRPHQDGVAAGSLPPLLPRLRNLLWSPP